MAALDHLKILENPSLICASNINAASQIRGRAEIGHLFIFDRNIDYATTLLSPLTYESLLDEAFGINCGVVDLGKEITKTNNSVKVRNSFVNAARFNKSILWLYYNLSLSCPDYYIASLFLQIAESIIKGSHI